MTNFYEVLGVEKTATADEIKKAYRKLASLHHPDKCPDDVVGATAKFKEITEAYETLSDTNKRSRYDNPHTQNFGGLFDFFNSDFNPVVRGRNVQVRVQVTLEEILTGCQRDVKVKNRSRCQDCNGDGGKKFEICENCQGSGTIKVSMMPFQVNATCNMCHGSGRKIVEKCEKCEGSGMFAAEEKVVQVKIPAGVENGMQLKVAGEGEASKTGDMNGDLLILIVVEDHPVFTREQQDLSLTVPVSYTQLVFGADLEIKTLQNDVVVVKLPAGSQSSAKLRLRGKGLPDLAKRGPNGDIIVKIQLETPKELNEEYSNVLKQLAELEKKYITPLRKKREV